MVETINEALGQTALKPKQESEKQIAYLKPYIDATEVNEIRELYGDVPSIRFQYWPESLSDQKDSTWEERKIPGLSHPLYHWSSGGGRTLTFTAAMARDNDPDEIAASSVLTPTDKVHNYDIEAAIAWLRSFQLPTYTDEGVPLPPPKLFLYLQGMRLGLDNQMGVLCYLSGCDITVQNWFPGGKIRYVEVALSFIELIQKDRRILTRSRKVLLDQTEFDKKLPRADIVQGQTRAAIEAGRSVR
jgi:hypothetical protein